MIPHAFAASPLFGITITLVAYALALAVHARLRWLHPLLLTCVLVMSLLLVTHIAPADYKIGGDIIAFFLGPATVALAVPLYKHRLTLARHALQIAVAIVAGCVTGILSAGAVAVAFHATRDVLLSILSKSATTPISIEITRALGGKPELAAAITVCTGLFGAVAGPPLLHALGFRKHSSIGLAVGTCSHGIGTSSVLRHSELQGTYAGLAMALNGILTAAILTPAAPLIQRLL
jgi:predicted murein hydrolase (TIGR00659 family)